MLRGNPVDVRYRERQLYSVKHFQVPEAFLDDLEGILIPEGEAKSRVNKLREEINDHYKVEDTNLMCIPVLKGALNFFADLLYDSRFEIPYEVGTVRSSRYGLKGDADEKKDAKVDLPDPESIEGKDIVLVEDIIDRGITLSGIVKEIRKYKPKSVSLVSLADKPSRRVPEVDLEELFDNIWIGFLVPDLFIVGYGLDYREQYRSLGHIAVLKSEVYESS